MCEGVGLLAHITKVARLPDLPHRGGPLANGRLDGHVVVCRWHGWTFDVRTGRPDHPGGHCVAAYEVKVRRSDIYVGWIKP